MTNATQLIEELCLGELSNLYVGEEFLSEDGLSETNARKLYAYLNQGLREISTRLNLIQKELFLDTHAAISRYYLRKDFAVSNNASSEPVRYINDVGEKFQGDVVKILALYNELGCEIPLNDIADCGSILTPEFDCLQFPYVELLNSYSVIYQAAHPEVDWEPSGKKALVLPPLLLEALKSYVAWKAYSFLNGDGPTNKGLEKKAEFDALMIQAELVDAGNTTTPRTTHKLCQRGFV